MRIKINKFIIIYVAFLIKFSPVEGSFEDFPKDINYKIISHTHLLEDLLSLRLVSKLGLENVYGFMVMQEFGFLQESKYTYSCVLSIGGHQNLYSLREKAILQYFKRVYNLNYVGKQVLKDECFLRHKLNRLDETDFTDPNADSDNRENINIEIEDIHLGISYLKRILKTNPYNLSEEYKLFTESIYDGLDTLLNDTLESAEGRYLYGKLCFYGHYLYPKNSRRSRKLLREAQESINSICIEKNDYQNQAQYFIWKNAPLLFIVINPDKIQTSHQLLEEAAHGGLSAAQYHLALYYEDLALTSEEKSPEQQEHYSKAYFYYGEAAKQQSAKACFQLGNLFLEGRGIPVCLPDKALEYYMKAALLGHLKAATKVGLLYYAGIGTPQENFPIRDPNYQEHMTQEFETFDLQKWWQFATEHAKACYWWQYAAQSGDPEAQFYMGWMYENGYNGEYKKYPDYAQECYQGAADQGDTSALIKLGGANSNDFTKKEHKIFKTWENIGSVDLIDNIIPPYSATSIKVPIGYEISLVKGAPPINEIAVNIVGTYYETGQYTLQNREVAEKLYKFSSRKQYLLPFLRLQIMDKVTVILSNLNLNLGERGTHILTQLLPLSANLSTLMLSNCNIEDKGASVLAETLKKNTTLKVLSLGHNQVKKEGTLALAKALEENTTLTSLNLAFNQIDNKSAKAFIENLKQNTTLVSLRLAQIDDESAKLLNEILKRNTTLASLKLKDESKLKK